MVTYALRYFQPHFLNLQRHLLVPNSAATLMLPIYLISQQETSGWHRGKVNEARGAGLSKLDRGHAAFVSGPKSTPRIPCRLPSSLDHSGDLPAAYQSQRET